MIAFGAGVKVWIAGGVTDMRRGMDQLELQLEELETTAIEDALAAEQAQGDEATVKSFTRRKPTRKPFPEHPLPGSRCMAAMRGGRANGWWLRLPLNAPAADQIGS
jgi:hypothetical protein